MHAHFPAKITCSHLALAYTSKFHIGLKNGGKYQRDEGNVRIKFSLLL